MKSGPMFGMKFRAVKGQFFDVSKVKRGSDDASYRVLGRFGAWVRKSARWSIRRRKGYSDPGDPPRGHVGCLKDFIYFWFDRFRRSVMVGPVKMHGRSPYGETTVPEILEHGGTVTRTDRKGRTTQYTYEARPYMGPAFEKGQQQLPKMWRDSIKR